jgi:hypothetical protein
MDYRRFSNIVVRKNFLGSYDMFDLFDWCDGSYTLTPIKNITEYKNISDININPNIFYEVCFVKKKNSWVVDNISKLICDTLTISRPDDLNKEDISWNVKNF